MKPFDLEAAKRGEPIMSDDGVHCRFVAFIPEAELYQQVIVYSSGAIYFYSKDGKGSFSRHLVMAPKKRTVWVVLYPNGSCAANQFNDEVSANTYATAANSYGLVPAGGKAYPVEIEE